MLKAIEITITRREFREDSGALKIEWNVQKNGNPFGKMWTWEAEDEEHPVHVQSLAGVYKAFHVRRDGGYDAAEKFMRGLM